MNYDRFKARIWDKQEKEMYYVGDNMPDNCYLDVVRKYYDNFTLIAVNEYGVAVGAYTKEIDNRLQILNISFGDRFVPMQCTGLKDKNGKLIYEGDIIVDVDSNYLIYWRTEYYGFLAKCLPETLDLSLDNFRYSEVFGSETEIIGNKWETPELLEESK